MIVEVSTLDDERLDAYARLTEAQLRSKLEPERALFIAESGKVIERALAGGMEPLSLLMEEKWRAPSVADVVAGARRIAVLEDITNHTNVGAIFRSAAALGVDAVLVTPACYDPLYRRAVRVSMGTVFQVPWTRIGCVRDWAVEGVPLLRSLGFSTAALALADDALPLHDARLRACERLALVLGTEGDGLAPSTVAACDYVVRIPMDHGVDSLNVAAASAVAFWELRTKWRD